MRDGFAGLEVWFRRFVARVDVAARTAIFSFVPISRMQASRAARRQQRAHRITLEVNRFN